MGTFRILSLEEFSVERSGWLIVVGTATIGVFTMVEMMIVLVMVIIMPIIMIKRMIVRVMIG